MPAQQATPPPGRSPCGRPRVRRWGGAVGLFVPLLLLWLALHGIQALHFGVAAAALGTAAGLLAAPGDPCPLRLLRLPGFILYFLYHSLRGGVDVAWRALHPGLPVAPCFVEHPLSLPAGPPRTLMVSLISLLPGSLCVEVDEARQRLLVHLLDESAAHTLPSLERQVARLAGLGDEPQAQR
jgi:multicomponent Na+:H+ antiporter subunit E